MKDDVDSAVSLEVLTLKDLKKQGNSNIALEQNDKVYLIATYAVAYDRVHYPLPLIMQSTNSHQDLMNKYKEAERERLASIQELSSVRFGTNA